jgi:hypothetical protein
MEGVALTIDIRDVGKAGAELAAATAAVLIQPYRDLLDRLHSEGRVTNEEMDALQQEIADRHERSTDLIFAKLDEHKGSA